MTVLFKAGRLVGLNFLPHEAATDGAKGVLETDAGTELGKVARKIASLSRPAWSGS
jgi:hypothetical protein